jgi:hypothetical protein
MKNIRLLLMTPFMSYKDRWGQYYKGVGDTFSQGIGSIADYLEKNNVPVDVIEPDIEGMDIEQSLCNQYYTEVIDFDNKPFHYQPCPSSFDGISARML